MATTEETISLLQDSLTALTERVTELERVYEFVKIGSIYIHNQVDINRTDNIIIIKAENGIVKSRTLLPILPFEAITIDGDHPTVKLRIKYNAEDYADFTIKKETLSGSIVAVDNGDIVPNRLLWIRFVPYNNSEVIIVNSPIHGDISLSNLTVSGDIKCYGSVYNKLDGADGEYVYQGKQCVNEDSIDSLREEIEESYQKKIIISALDADEYIKSDVEIPVGTIYAQVEDE